MGTTKTDVDDVTAIRDRVREATELLEAVDGDRGLLAHLTSAERERFLRVTRAVSDPDPRARRRLVKATRRLRKAAVAERDESVLTTTGIRELRRKPVFNAPNYFRRQLSAPEAPPATSESRHCYVCKKHYQTV